MATNASTSVSPTEEQSDAFVEALSQKDASDVSRSNSTSSHRPDHNDEVTALNDKLIRSINQQTSLDDAFQQTRHELDASKKRIVLLERDAKAYEESLTSGALVKREDVEQSRTQMNAELATVRKERSAAQQEKRAMEAELENLTVSLFDEANKMVAAANREREAAEKKSQQLREQIKDGETLLASQSEQLAELKLLMQSIAPDRSLDRNSPPQLTDTLASPSISRDEYNVARLLEAMNLSPASPETGQISPAPSTTFSHLIKSVCRFDIPAYDEFRSLVQLSTRSNHPSRAGSGSYGGLGVIGISSLSSITNSPASANNSSTSLNNLNSHGKQPSGSAGMPGGFNSVPAPASPDVGGSMRGPIPLKDTKFYKRLLTEDVEPTLRLDLSANISWLNRRAILNAFAESVLIVEPIPESSRKLYGKYTPCALCGESRKENENPRTHRMRVSEGEGATKWPLCLLCLEKVRGVGDLVGYVRMIRDGVVKCHDRAEEREAWEELIRLRERLFWARMAGGVVPSFIPTRSDNESAAPATRGITMSEGGHTLKNLNSVNDEAGRKSASSDGDSTSTSQEDAAEQLQAGLDESLTTFANIKDKPIEAFKSPTATPPSTPPRKRESGGAFPKLNIPRMTIPESFWKNEVNTLR